MILVLVETGSDGVTPLTLQALTFARALAGSGDPDGSLNALVVGDLPEPVTGQLGEYGVSVVHQAEDPAPGSYAAAARATALAATVAAHEPAVVLGPGSPRGTEVLAHVAARLGVPLAANCVAASGSGPMVVQRQVMGGSALEEAELPAEPALLTLAGHVVEAQPAAAPTTPTTIRYAPAYSEADLVGRVRRVEQTTTSGTDLATARVVVGAGRGVGGADRFGPLQDLVTQLGGALGVSRVVTSLGWRPHHEQVGQTGTRIAPDVYLACGISGAIQHWAGCSGAKTVIAINTDAEAPMVTKAHYAVIGDLHEIVPAISAELARRSSGP